MEKRPSMAYSGMSNPYQLTGLDYDVICYMLGPNTLSAFAGLEPEFFDEMYRLAIETVTSDENKNVYDPSVREEASRRCAKAFYVLLGEEVNIHLFK